MACRVMTGQRAAVCGLVLAGVSLGDACKIVAVPYHAMHAALPKGWHVKKMPPRKWKGDRLVALKRAYADRSMTVETVAKLFKTDAGIVRLLARRHGWPRRPAGMVSIETRLQHRSRRLAEQAAAA